ncbi:MAG: Nramp family divalent metal transporter [Gemmatimonadaceae bacterium]|nr:Nramp family divalent metal transporter [Gemmatimonadaceae bacterium]
MTSTGRLARFWRTLGPGLITGAADDDPSGIATYSLAGAQFGTGLLWLPIISWPLMWAVQYSCARIGMVTGRGLMASLRRRYPRPVLVAVCLALFLANGINIGADLAGMADGAELLTGVDSHIWVILFGFGIMFGTVRLRYRQMARVLKWLSLVLVAYVITALISNPDWSSILHDMLTPRWPRSSEGWAMVVAIFGTTISPYLFFWQASEEVEEEKAEGRLGHQRFGASAADLSARSRDVATGAFAATLTMFFIMLTTALTLHAHGITHPTTTKEVASALEPLAGRAAMLLYTIGLLGTGALAIPTLAGATAYAVAELLTLRQGIDERFHRAPAFYAIVLASIAGAVIMDFLHISVVRALFWTAVINGLLAPLLLVAIARTSADRDVMHQQPSSRVVQSLVWSAATIMTIAAVLMFVL